jgi:hypothetical protein
LDSNSHQLDPLFVSPSSPSYDLSIPVGSPAVNAGNVTLSYLIDINGLTRDANPDIGAYEYITSH